MSTVSANGLEISYEVRGQGPALLLVAGTGYAGETWWPPLIDDLARDHTVIRYDHRGTGRTVGGARPFTTRDLAADGLALLEALGVGPAYVLGHSMGGRVAQWMALDGPERVAGLILAASGPGARPGAGEQTAGVPVAAAAGMVELGYRKFVADVQRRTFFNEDFAVREPDVVRWLDEAFWRSRPSLTDYFHHVSARQRHNTVDELARLDTPTLVLVGDRDTYLGGTGSHLEQSQYLAAELPRASLTVLPGAKHGFLWETPVESASVIREWIAGTT